MKFSILEGIVTNKDVGQGSVAVNWNYYVENGTGK